MRMSDWSSDVCSSDLQVGRTDEQGIDAVDRGDLLDPVERFARLDLHHQAQLFVDAVEIVANGAESRRPNGDAGDTSDPLGREPRGADDRARLLGVVHHRHQQDRKSTTSELQSLMRISYAVFCL